MGDQPNDDRARWAGYRRKPELYLAVGTPAYVGLAGWLVFDGIQGSGSNVQTAFLMASLIAVWPVAWGFGVWSAVVRAGFSRRASALIALAVVQMIGAVGLAYVQAAAATSYFDAFPLVLLALFVATFWYALLGIKRAEYFSKLREQAQADEH